MDSIISGFPNITQTKDGKDISIKKFLNYIKDGKWKELIEQVRTGKAEKRALPYVTISGKFDHRSEAGLIKHSGFICIDVDGVDPGETKSIICPDPFIYAAFSSASGNGLALLIRINPENHKGSFAALEEYFYDKYGIIIDTACKDVSRPRFISFDSDLYLNEAAAIFTHVKEDDQAKPKNVIYVQSDFDYLIFEITRREINLCEHYHEWLRCGFALVDKFGEGGRKYFHSISAISSKYNVATTDKQYDNCLRGSRGGVTIATFYHYAQMAGVDINPRVPTSIELTVHPNGSLSDHTDNGKPKVIFDKKIPLVTQVKAWLKTSYDLRRNVITRKVEHDGRELDSVFLNTIFIDAKKIFEKLSFELLERIILSDYVTEFNPLINFFTLHKDINPTGHIDRLFECIETDTGFDESNFFPGYLAHFGKKWLVSMIASAYGEHSPLMLVLVGSRQGTGKTEFFRRLMPPSLRKYFAESKLDREKDDELLMTQKWVIMDDEMGGKSKREAERLKELTSRDWFSLREPYGRYNIDIKRLAVLCGTTNHEEIINDITGNRRIIPVNVLWIDQDAYNAIDKTALIMEAHELYQAGFDWRLNMEDVQKLKQNTERFEDIQSERELLLKFFLPGENNIDCQFMSTTEIKSFIEKETLQKITTKKLGFHLKEEGFVRVSRKLDKRGVKGYWVNILRPGVAR